MTAGRFSWGAKKMWITTRLLSAPSSKGARLRVVVRHRVGEVSGALQHWLNLWPSQEARMQHLIPDALRQPLDDRRCLPKRGARLRLLSTCLIQRSYRSLDLPASSWQPEFCC